ncbi:MAG: hypothetical protein KDE53_37410 [Caldilineaceae bacterium]|nr:hypothetical protein [Caldilineaceae bacterium]MCB0124300.1 hypothetical protein [Caldilineaceae bacterium]
MDQDQIKRLLTAIFADVTQAMGSTDDSQPCHANQEEIVVYIEAEQAGEPVAALYPALSAQLQSCTRCQTLYAELKDLLDMVQAETLVAPPPPATFQLPISAAPFNARPRAIDSDSAETIVKQQTDDHSILWTLNGLGQVIATFSTDLLALFQPPPQPSFLKAPPRNLFTIQSPSISDDLQITLAARTVRHHPELCTLTVTCDIPSRGGWPNLGGTTVTLVLGRDEVATQPTDTFGRAMFEGIACAALAHVQVLVQPEI